MSPTGDGRTRTFGQQELESHKTEMLLHHTKYIHLRISYHFQCSFENISKRHCFCHRHTHIKHDFFRVTEGGSVVLTISPLPPSAFSWCWRSRCGKVGVFLRRSVTEVIEQMCNDRGTCASNCCISHKFSKQQLTPYYKCAYTIYKNSLLDNYKSLIACRTHNNLWRHQNFESCLTKIK